MQIKKFKGSINLLKRNNNIVNLYDLYNESDNFDEKKSFDGDYLAHCFRFENNNEYEPTKSKYFLIFRSKSIIIIFSLNLFLK